MVMQPDKKLLPSALRPVAESTGLHFVPSLTSESGSLPIACPRLPVTEKLAAIVDVAPVAVNFHRVVLDMDKKEDQDEYVRTMSYLGSGYGGKLEYRERQFIKKRYTKDGKTKVRCVQRIFLEYFAPYRVLPTGLGNFSMQESAATF
jgi:hypothetical protein